MRENFVCTIVLSLHEQHRRICLSRSRSCDACILGVAIVDRSSVQQLLDVSFQIGSDAFVFFFSKEESLFEQRLRTSNKLQYKVSVENVFIRSHQFFKFFQLFFVICSRGQRSFGSRLFKHSLVLCPTWRFAAL